LGLNESIAFGWIEPLHSAASHAFYLSYTRSRRLG
jgi:hypothetical protein